MITPTQLMKKIRDLASRADAEFLLLGNCLRRLRALDREVFTDAINHRNLGSRKAYYLVELAEGLKGASLPRKRLQAIGWTKAQIIAKHINRHNALDLLRIAEGSNARDLAIRMRGRKPSKGTRCELLYFTKKQYAHFEEAAVEHGAVKSGRGLTNKEKAVMALIGKTPLSRR